MKNILHYGKIILNYIYIKCIISKNTKYTNFVLMYYQTNLNLPL